MRCRILEESLSKLHVYTYVYMCVNIYTYIQSGIMDALPHLLVSLELAACIFVHVNICVYTHTHFIHTYIDIYTCM